MDIAEQYTTKFGENLANAAPNLFTFLLYNFESLREGYAFCGGKPQHAHVNARHVEVQHIVNVGQNMAVAQHLDMV